MKVNFVTQILHATKKLVSPRGEIEDLNSDSIKARLITATETLTSEKDLNVTGENGTATIRDLDVTDTADVKNKLTVENDTKTKNLEVAPDKLNKGGNATIHNAIIKSLDNDSQAWATDANGGKAKDLITDLNEFEVDYKNESTAGKSTKVARADHTHKIPNAIKNPYQLKIQGVNVGENTPVHAYDGSECHTSDSLNGDTFLKIDYDFTGAAKKNHADASAVFGVGDATKYGHTKLYEMKFKPYNRDNDNVNQTIIDSVNDKGVDSGTALTPSSLASYAKYVNEYVHANFIEKPRTPDETVTIIGNVKFAGNIEVRGRIRIKDAGYIDGYEIGDNERSRNRIKIYGLDNSQIGKLQFGKDDINGKSNTVLRSNQSYDNTHSLESADTHLYIEHDYESYISKIVDYEIECIITPQTEKNSRIWVPSKSGLYRIYLIGGGGFGSGGDVADKYNHTSSNGNGGWVANTDSGKGPHAGYGLGDALAGIGGGGGPVVEIDLETAEASSAAIDGETPTISSATCSSPSARGFISITAKHVSETDGSVTYDGNVSITNVYGGTFNAPNDSISSATVVNGSCSFNFSGVSASSLTITESTADEVTTFNVTGGNIVIPSVTTSLDECKLSGGGASTANIYTITSITFTSITIYHDTSDDVGTSDEEIDEERDEDDEDGDIGARFVFFNSYVYTATAHEDYHVKHSKRFPYTNSSNQPANYTATRSIGVQNLSSVGTIVNPSSTKMTSDEAGSGMPTELTYKTLKDYYDIVSMVGTDDKSKATTDIIDVFVGHGMDAGIIADRDRTQKSPDKYTGLTNAEIDDYNRGVITPCELDGMKRRYTVADRTTNAMHCGTRQRVGTDGFHFKNGVKYNNMTENTRTSQFRNPGNHYACQDGYDGGCPGNVGITGGLPGKGSKGGVVSKNGKQYSTGNTRKVSFKGGCGASFELGLFDGYNGSIYHSDRSTSKTQLILPGKNSKLGGLGYLGGGHGGGGAMTYNSSKTYVTSQAVKQKAVSDRKKLEPCAVIIYLGKKNK